jgi:HlyD family secretion protein
MHRTTRLLIVAAIGIAIVATLAWLALRPVPVTAEVAKVSRGPMSVTIDVDGVTRIRDIWEVSAPIAGTTMRSPVRVGDPVLAGETIVAVVQPVAPSLLDFRSRSQAEAAVHEAEAALAVAESRVAQSEEDLAYARSQFDRAKALVERGVASLVRLEDAAQSLKVNQAAHDTALSAKLMADSTLERARAALIGPGDIEGGDIACCIEIRAPSDGVVLSIDRISERPVLAGERLLSIGDPRNLEIVADPLSRDAVRIPPDARAVITRWGGQGTLEAKLRKVEPSAYTEVSALGIEEQRVQAIFDFTDPPGDRETLADGYAVRLAIEVWAAADVLRVPLGALFREDGVWSVFAVRDGLATLVPVEIGQRNERVAELTAGLGEDDLVVVHPGDAIADGVSVVPLLRE